MYGFFLTLINMLYHIFLLFAHLSRLMRNCLRIIKHQNAIQTQNFVRLIGRICLLSFAILLILIHDIRYMCDRHEQNSQAQFLANNFPYLMAYFFFPKKLVQMTLSFKINTVTYFTSRVKAIAIWNVEGKFPK